jgi:type VI secretion system secreted protein VgrG
MTIRRQASDQLFGAISQQSRLLKLDSPMGSNALLPQRVYARDRITAGYDYTVDLLSLQSDIELKKLIAQKGGI